LPIFHIKTNVNVISFFSFTETPVTIEFHKVTYFLFQIFVTKKNAQDTNNGQQEIYTIIILATLYFLIALLGHKYYYHEYD